LIIGVGFIGAACLDGYHALVTLSVFAPYLPSDLPDLITWSWVASRQFLAIMMCLCWLASRRDAQNITLDQKGDPQPEERLIYIFAITLTLASFVFFIYAPLPHAYFPKLIFHRPEDIPSALCFLATLVGFLKLGSWRHDRFEHWLVLSLIIGCVGQALIMPFSSELFDLEFSIAHLLKIASYLCVLTDLLINMRATFHQAVSDKNALAQEIVVRKEAEITARQNERRLRAVFASVADGIITINQQGTVQLINTGAETLFGYHTGDVVGQNIKMLMPQEYAHTHDKDVASYKRTGESSVVGARRDLMGLRKNGTTFPIDLIISEMHIAGERMFTGVVRDKTAETEVERKRQHAQAALRRHRDAAVKVARELKRSNAELEQFASVAAHDLQEPLRKVQAFGDRLGSRYANDLDEKGLDYIARMQDAAARMQVLISDLL
jgi:PAS domain S-box-containing protein